MKNKMCRLMSLFYITSLLDVFTTNLLISAINYLSIYFLSLFYILIKICKYTKSRVVKKELMKSPAFSDRSSLHAAICFIRACNNVKLNWAALRRGAACNYIISLHGAGHYIASLFHQRNRTTGRLVIIMLEAEILFCIEPVHASLYISQPCIV